MPGGRILRPASANRVCLQHRGTREHSRGRPLCGLSRAPARSPLTSGLLESPDIDENREVCLPGEFAEAVAVSTRIFSQLAAKHDQFVRSETAARLNLKGTAKTFQVGEKVKVRVPPTASQLEETGRTASKAHNRVERPLHYRGAP
jgi:hypothetical protein